MIAALHGGPYHGARVTLPDRFAGMPIYVLPEPAPGLDAHLAASPHLIPGHVMTRVVVYQRHLAGVYACTAAGRCTAPGASVSPAPGTAY